MKRVIFILMFLIPLMVPGTLTAQSELASTLEVLAAGVEVQRVNTEIWIPITVEAIVGVGDTIRTGETGRARITFFADGTDTELQPNTEYRILQFEGNENSFKIGVEVLTGQTVQRLNRLLDANSSYDVTTPGLQMVARGTEFAIRVEEDSKRSAMIVTEGTVGAQAQDSNAAVSPGFGVRAERNASLSDVVPATSFEKLDAALDGCSVQITTPDDVSINVRIGPSLEAPQIGTISAAEIDTFIGVTDSGDWYRIEFRDGYAWILSSTAQVNERCVGLRPFPDNHGPEDASLYTSLGDSIQLEDLPTPESPVESTPEPTDTP